MSARAARESQFDAAIAQNEADLLRYFERRLTSHADAAEAHGELLLVAWKHHRKLPAEPEQARMWLFGIARNVLHSARRSLARHSAAVQRFVDEARLVEDDPAQSEGAAIREAVESLHPDDAELVRLVYWDGFRTHEAAEIMGINASTVRSRLSRIRSELKNTLGLDEGVAPPGGWRVFSAAV